MSPLLNRLWYVSLGALGLTVLTRHLSRGAVILCYHNVVARGSAQRHGDSALHADEEQFGEQMEWLSSHYDVVPLGELVARVNAPRRFRPTAAVTFDDGYMGVFQHAWPILRSLNIPATVFVVAEAPGRLPAFWWDHPAVESNDRARLLYELRGDHRQIIPVATEPDLPLVYRPAPWETIQTAQVEGLEVGSHSLSHRTLTRLADDELAQEACHSREIIRSRLGMAPQWFAYPYGIWDDRVRAAVRSAGYSGALALGDGQNRPGGDPWSLPRINVPASISHPAFQAWMAGLSRQQVA